MACSDDEGASSGDGTGGDEEMPDDRNPGPDGPNCEPFRVGLIVDEPAARSQPARVSSSVRISEVASSPLVSPRNARLTPSADPARATTVDPHVHERWDEARKLELAYCINFVPGDDAELEANYHKLMRILVSTTAEWERSSDVNFIHLRGDDEPEATPHLSAQGEDVSLDAARCVAGTQAYFGVVAGLRTYQRDGATNTLPQAWDDPALESPGPDAIARILQVNSQIVDGFGDIVLASTLRHELGHIMGFVHEETSMDDPDDECVASGPRPLTPLDSASVMATPACEGLGDAGMLSSRDRLSAFFLHHTPRSRFELRASNMGYRFGRGPLGTGAEILWHSAGAQGGIRWRPQGGSGISFSAEPYSYIPTGMILPNGWYPSQSEVVVPLRLGGDEHRFDLLFLGPGPDVNDFAVLTTGHALTVLPWSGDEFVVPVVGSFDPDDANRDVVYLYRPGPDADVGLVVENGAVSLVEDVPQQDAYAYPLAAPYRGSGFPDDVIWLDPMARQVITWRWTAGLFGPVSVNSVPFADVQLPTGELNPVIGDFDGNGQADIMWHGVSAPPNHADTTDVVWRFASTSEDLAFDLVPKAVGAGYRPFVGDFDGDGHDDVFWHRQWGMTATGPSGTETGPSFLWYFDALAGHEAKAYALEADRSPYVGDFDGDGCHDIAWFDAPADSLHVWRCLPGERDFACEEAMATPPSSAPVGVHWGF